MYRRPNEFLVFIYKKIVGGIQHIPVLFPEQYGECNHDRFNSTIKTIGTKICINDSKFQDATTEITNYKQINGHNR